MLTLLASQLHLLASQDVMYGVILKQFPYLLQLLQLSFAVKIQKKKTQTFCLLEGE